MRLGQSSKVGWWLHFAQSGARRGKALGHFLGASLHGRIDLIPDMRPAEPDARWRPIADRLWRDAEQHVTVECDVID